VFVLDEDTDRADLVRQSLTIGHEAILGELDGGLDTWTAAGLPTTSIALVDADGMRGTILDIRQTNEWDAGHVPGAIHAELGVLDPAAVPQGPVTVMCGHGERAMTAASVLQAGGHDDLAVLAGGPADWTAATGTPLVTR
jgi:rhodanese-related sulfurtransferase